MLGVPTHIGFIADGNRRWAKERNLPTLEGHHRGSKVAEMIVDELKSTEVKFLSLYVFSTENWNRSPEEINYLMKLLGESIEQFGQKAKKDNLRIILLGRPEPVEANLWQKLIKIETDTTANTGLTVCFCFNYGGQYEIVDAARKMCAAGDKNYTPENFRQYLYHPEVPDCDLIIRTSGEERLSGFQLWRAAYAELLFLDKHFPDLQPQDVQDILQTYAQRQRRFGK